MTLPSAHCANGASPFVSRILAAHGTVGARRARVADATANLGESEVREALLATAVFFVNIGDKASRCSARSPRAIAE